MQQGQIKISVIISVHSDESCVRECLDSVLCQSLEEIEVICISDDPGCEKIIKEYVAKDFRVLLVPEQKESDSMGQRQELKGAKGEYISFLDSDDRYPDLDVLRILYDKALETGIMICGGSLSTQMKSELPETQNIHKYTFVRDEVISYRDYQLDQGFHQFIYNSKFLKTIGLYFYPRSYAQKINFFVNAMITAGRFYAVRKESYYFGGKETNTVETEEAQLDFLKNMQGILRLSAIHRLKALHCLIVQRLSQTAITKKKTAQISKELINALKEVEMAIDSSLLYGQRELIAYWHNLQNMLMSFNVEVSPDKNTFNNKIESDRAALKKDTQSAAFIEKGKDGQYPLATVIIPVYRVEDYILECVQSVCHQTLANIEILIVNDGTPDRSIDIIRPIVNKDSRMRILMKENGGLSSARNAGLEEAQGEYILFLDSDDFLKENALELLYQKSKELDLDDLFYSAEVIFENDCTGNEYDRYLDYYQRKGDYAGVQKGTSLFAAFIENKEFKPNACIQFYRRSFLVNNKIMFCNGILHEDNLFTMQCLLYAERTSYLNKELYCRRIHADSIMTGKHGIKNAYGYFCGIKEIIETAGCFENTLDENYITALIYQLNVMTDVAANFIKGISKAEIADFLKKCNFDEKIMFFVSVHKVAQMKQEISDARKSENDWKRVSDNLIKTVNAKKTENRELLKNKRNAEACEREKNKEIENLKTSLERLQTENKNNKMKVAKLETRLKEQEEEFRNSTSYRVGRIVTFLPRMVKKIFKG